MGNGGGRQSQGRKQIFFKLNIEKKKMQICEPVHGEPKYPRMDRNLKSIWGKMSAENKHCFSHWPIHNVLIFSE